MTHREQHKSSVSLLSLVSSPHTVYVLFFQCQVISSERPNDLHLYLLISKHLRLYTVSHETMARKLDYQSWVKEEKVQIDIERDVNVDWELRMEISVCNLATWGHKWSLCEHLSLSCWPEVCYKGACGWSHTFKRIKVLLKSLFMPTQGTSSYRSHEHSSWISSVCSFLILQKCQSLYHIEMYVIILSECFGCLHH